MMQRKGCLQACCKVRKEGIPFMEGLRGLSTLAEKPNSYGSYLPRVPIDKILVANRGEIACRVIATARRLGIPTVAVFSKPDASACHVAMADESVCIGPASAKDSYLRQDRILEAAVSTGATAIHPGYGFLSENATFASECRNNNLIFVGPSAAAILAMGDKAQAKTLMASAKVPIVPGYHGDDQNDELLKGEADRIGYPLLVKAIMGGGGKGMKLAKNNKAFMEALHSARREAMASFGDDRVILEKFIEVPRHIEVQVIADTFGNYYYLAERDCSVQRRHQKIIEEAPAPQISENFRRKLGFSALEAAKAVQYCNAGTIEFIVDSLSGTHYFMEMNTRLQVEHPVTEAVTGVDLVELQLRVASGQSLKDLGFLQSNLEPVGHAVEARLYAENPLNDFLPSGGELLRWRMPVGASAFGFGTEHDESLNNTDGIQSIDSREIVRVDSGVKQGDEVGVYYDPMIAKVIAKASDRNKALTALSDALGSLQIAGFPTNVAFVQRLLNHREFRKGPVDTGFISRHEEELLAPVSLSSSTAVIAAIAMLMRQVMNDGNMYEKPFFVGKEGDPNNITEYTQVISNPWSISDSFRLNHSHTIEIPTIKHIGSDIPIDAVVQMKGQNNCIVSFRNLGGELPRHCSIVKYNGRHIQAIVDDHLLSSDLEFHQHGNHLILDIWLNSTNHQFSWEVTSCWSRGNGDQGDSSSLVSSPMPGRIIRVCTHKDAIVKSGQTICIIEAMKMEHPVCSPCDGKVKELMCLQGSQVNEGQHLARVEQVQTEDM